MFHCNVFSDMGVSTIVGYVLWKGMENKDESSFLRQYEDKSAPETKKLYNEHAMMKDMLQGGGKTSLKEIREETTKKRLEIAEKHATYNTAPVPAPSEKET